MMKCHDSRRCSRRVPSHRRSPVPVIAVAVLTLLTATVVSPGLFASQSAPAVVTSIELTLDSTRREALLAGGKAVPAAQLFSEALTVKLGGAARTQVVLFAFRIRDGRIVSRFESSAFPAAPGVPVRALASGALPGPAFFSGAEVGLDGIGLPRAVGAAAGASDPVRIVVSSVAGKPADWHEREAIYAIAVSADKNLRGEAWSTPVVVFGDEIVTLTATPGGAGGAGGTPKNAAGILRRAAQADQLCGGWVQDYTLYRMVETFVIPEYYERDGAGPGCRKVPITEYMDRFYEQAGMPPQRWSHGQADGLNLLGGGLKQGIEGAGVPGVGNLAEIGTGLMADFVRAGADIDPDTLMPEDAQRRRADFAEFARRASSMGTETVDGRQAYHLRAEGLEDIAIEQPQSGPQFTLKAASLWVDTETWVPLGMRFEGVSEEGGRSQPIAIAMAQKGWTLFPAPVPDGGVLLPTSVVMRITGINMFDDGDRAKMEKAAADAAKLKADLHKMPAGVRNMMLQQIERLERMAAPGGESIAEANTALLHAVLNEGPPYPGGTGSFGVGGILFPAMVLASWAERSGEWQQAFFQAILPESLEFQGRVGEGRDAIDGWLKVSVLLPEDLSWLREYEGSIATVLPIVVRGGYQRNGDPPEAVTYEERSGALLVTMDGRGGFSRYTSMAFGEIRVPTYGASFTVGHMPCSTAPRSITHQVNIDEECTKEERRRAAAGDKRENP